MPGPLGILKLEKDGGVVWKRTAESLEVAKLSVRVMAENSSGDYLIFSPTDSLFASGRNAAPKIAAI